MGGKMPSALGIQSQWQCEMILKHGHRKGVTIDAMFGTHKFKDCILPCFSFLFHALGIMF